MSSEILQRIQPSGTVARFRLPAGKLAEVKRSVGGINLYETTVRHPIVTMTTPLAGRHQVVETLEDGGVIIKFGPYRQSRRGYHELPIADLEKALGHEALPEERFVSVNFYNVLRDKNPANVAVSILSELARRWPLFSVNPVNRAAFLREESAPVVYTPFGCTYCDEETNVQMEMTFDQARWERSFFRFKLVADPTLRNSILAFSLTRTEDQKQVSGWEVLNAGVERFVAALKEPPLGLRLSDYYRSLTVTVPTGAPDSNLFRSLAVTEKGKLITE
ncbi:hypothetical protein HZC35_07125 [Candidatus Saganbacteria bacterium]|nr:hypothetical protein [Candidatus Saganbacteria bacterium]